MISQAGPRFLRPRDSDRYRHKLPISWPHPGWRRSEIDLPRNTVNNTHKFRVGRSGKIGIIGLEALKSLAAWIATREGDTAKGVDSCDQQSAESPLPPAPAKLRVKPSGTGVDSGPRSGHAAANLEDSRTARRSQIGTSTKSDCQSSSCRGSGAGPQSTCRASRKGGRS